MSDSSLPERDSPVEVQTAAGDFRFVDNYGLLFSLGEGGMGEVWAARDASSPKNRVIALKTTKQEGAEAARILYDEARIASMIEHPNVCRVHHLGKADDTQYLVMDYCDGASLHDLLEVVPERRLPVGIACKLLSGAAAGLHAAHELTDDDGTRLGVVHRDVSPQNILISTKGQVTVADFGVAKALGQAHKATETGEMKGKLSYMAPEQVTSKDIDARADVFALGCVLYQVTLGRRPFHGDDALATLYQLLEQELELPTAIDAEFPPELEAVIVKALSKAREERYSSAAEFQRALAEVLVHRGERPTDDDVAAYLNEHLGESIERRKSAIKKRSDALDKYDRADRSGTVRVGSERAGAAAAPSANKGAAPSGGAPDERGSGSKYAAIGIFLAVVVGGILTLRSLSSDKASDLTVDRPPEPPSGAPSSVPDPQPDSSTTKVASVTLEVNATPPGAAILIDGKKVGQGKYSETVESSDEAHVLEISAHGHEPVTRALVFNKNHSITVALSPTEQGSPSPPPRVQPRPPPQPKPKRPPKTKPNKPPRKLDSDNPFATP